MKDDVGKLIDDPHFQRYHQEIAEAATFNTFDVLRYADYEIRHSNVLSWLLQPGASHGIGGRFLRWFVSHVNERRKDAGLDDIAATGFEAGNVTVERERHFVDVTVVFKREKY